MPNKDGTGPLGKGPRTGRMRGKGRGKGSKFCTCPSCDHKQENQRGVPCSKISCSKCHTPLKGEWCLEK